MWLKRNSIPLLSSLWFSVFLLLWISAFIPNKLDGELLASTSQESNNERNLRWQNPVAESVVMCVLGSNNPWTTHAVVSSSFCSSFQGCSVTLHILVVSSASSSPHSILISVSIFWQFRYLEDPAKLWYVHPRGASFFLLNLRVSRRLVNVKSLVQTTVVVVIEDVIATDAIRKGTAWAKFAMMCSCGEEFCGFENIDFFLYVEKKEWKINNMSIKQVQHEDERGREITAITRSRMLTEHVWCCVCRRRRDQSSSLPCHHRVPL